MILSNIPFADGLSEWASHLAPRNCTQTIKHLAKLVADGKNISTAVAESKFPASFRLVRMLEGLETNADPAALLSSIEEGLLEQEKIKQTLRQTIVYPALILALMSIVIVLFAFTMMEAVYDQGWQHQPPWFFWLYSVIHPIRFLLILLIPAAFWLVYKWMRDPLRIPATSVRQIFIEIERALFCQFCQLEIQKLRTITEALDAAALFFPSSFQAEIKQSANHSREGFAVDEDSGNLMTPQMRFFLNRSVSSEKLKENLEKLRDFHLEQARIYSSGLQKRVGLTFLLVLGICVGLVVIESFYFYYGYVIGKLPF